jgi:DNA phosphorothioation-associated DGQHR protein 1
VAARLNMNLLCSIFLDLPKPYQAQIFATINSNQKPVDKSLTYELFGYNIDEEPAELWSPDKLAVFLTRKLSVDLESPLRGRVSIAPLKDARLSELTQLGQWKVSTAVVVEGLLRLFSTNPKRDAQAMLTPSRSSRSSLKGGRVDRSPLRSYFVDGNDHLIYSLALNFLRACQNVFWSKAAEGSFIVKTVGIQALFDLLRKDLVVRALEEKDLRVDFFELHLSKASEIDFSSAPFRDASGSGRTRIRQALERAIFLPSGQQ